MEAFRVYLHLDLLEIVPSRGKQRRLIMDFIRSLEREPYVPGDCSDKDSSQRVRQIKIVGQFAITYWVDDPAKSVMIVDIRPADS